MARKRRRSIEPPIYAALHRNQAMEREWTALQQVLAFSRLWEHEWTGKYPPAMGAGELIIAVHLTELRVEDVAEDALLKLLLEAVAKYQNILEKVEPYGLDEAELAAELDLNAQGCFLRDDTLIRGKDPDYPADLREAPHPFHFSILDSHDPTWGQGRTPFVKRRMM